MAFIVLELFVLWRAATLPWLARRMTRTRWLATFVAGVAVFALARFVAHRVQGKVAAIVEVIGMDLLVAMLLATVCLLPVELLTLFGRLLPKVAPELRAAALALAALLFGAALVQGSRAPAVVDHEVILADLPTIHDGTVVVALSDMHLGNVLDADWLAERVEQVQALEPDVIVLLGDTFEGHYDSATSFDAALGSLSAPLGVWAVYGNHDAPWRGRSPKATYRRAGIEPLDDRLVELRPGLLLAGARYRWRRQRSAAPPADLARVLANRPAGATILLSHAPEQVELAAAAGVSLMLAGHTHGGQVWPVGQLVRLRYRWIDGRHEIGPMTLLVSRGTGSWGPRTRLWRRAEILRVTLRADSGPSERPRLGDDG